MMRPPTASQTIISQPRPFQRDRQITAIVVDWAGTVVDFGSLAPTKAFQATCAKHGVEITMAEAREPMGLAKRDHIQAILAMPDVASRWNTVHGGRATESAVDRLYADFVPTQMEILREHSDLIEGTLQATEYFRERAIKIGSSTGYNKQLMEVVIPLARQQGFEPDAVVCADDVRLGRPAPYMIFENCQRLGVIRPSGVVKVDDTVPGIEAGVHAGAWTVGIAETGNEMGLTRDQLSALDARQRQDRLEQIRTRFLNAGADFVANSIADLPQILQQIMSA